MLNAPHPAALDGYPATVNSYPACNAIVREAAAVFVGEARAGMPQKTMGAEDFSYFLEKVPGCFLFVGAAQPGDSRPHHKSVFDFDEVRARINCCCWETNCSLCAESAIHQHIHLHADCSQQALR